MSDNDKNLLQTLIKLFLNVLSSLIDRLQPYAKKISWLLLRRILRRPAKRPAPKALKGFYPYHEKDGEFFSRLERHTEVQHCLDLLGDANTALMIVYGASGSGKTSLLRAGIKYALDKTALDPHTPLCVYWPAGETDPASALVSAIEGYRKVTYQGNLANILKLTTDRLVILIDQFEQLKRDDPRHKPVFDFLRSVCNQPSPHAVQVVAAFDSKYFSEWLKFEQEAAIQPPRVPVSPLPVERAMKVMSTIMNQANITVDEGVEENYIQDMADREGVSPVAIALGALVFSTWNDIKSGVRLPDYVRADGIRAVLKAHVRERLGWAYVLTEDRGPLLNAIVTVMTQADKNKRMAQGASIESIAAAAGLAPERVKIYLKDLEEGRILEALPGSHLYIIAHDRFVPVLKELDQETAATEQAIGEQYLEQYLQWKRYKKRKYLLRGKSLNWVVKNEASFVAGPDQMDRTIYIRKSKTAARWRRYIVLPIAIIVLAGTAPLFHYLRVENFHKRLKTSHVPIELYNHQGDLEALIIDGSNLSDLNWLHSSHLNDLSITGQNLRSLDGLKSVKNLRSLEVSLDSAASVKGIFNLHKLKRLVLHNLGHAQNELMLDFSSVRELQEADLDLQGAKMQALPDLGPLSELQTLKLNLRDSTISDLSIIANLPQLSHVELLLDRSSVRSLAAIAGLDHLKTVHLSVDENQMQLLSDLGKSHAAFTLFLDLQPSLRPVPDISHTSGLRGLTIRILGANPGQIASMGESSQLRELGLIIDGSGIQQLPPLGQLGSLNTLELGLESTAVWQLPDISSLQGLERLILNLNSTGIVNLPNFEGLQNLKELHLFLRELRGGSLRGIEHLGKLQTLTLDITGARLADLDSLAKVNGLEKLILFLRWSQVRDLPDVSSLTNLHFLELHLEGDWGVEELPDITHLQSLQALSLTLDGSHIEKLPSLSQLVRLEKITVNLGGNSEMDISELANVNSLGELTLNFHGSAIQTLPDLRKLTNLRRTVVDISGSNIRDLSQFGNVPRLQELTIDQDFESLKGLPPSVRKLRIIPRH